MYISYGLHWSIIFNPVMYASLYRKSLRRLVCGVSTRAAIGTTPPPRKFSNKVSLRSASEIEAVGLMSHPCNGKRYRAALCCLLPLAVCLAHTCTFIQEDDDDMGYIVPQVEAIYPLTPARDIVPTARVTYCVTVVVVHSLPLRVVWTILIRLPSTQSNVFVLRARCVGGIKQSQ